MSRPSTKEIEAALRVTASWLDRGFLLATQREEQHRHAETLRAHLSSLREEAAFRDAARSLMSCAIPFEKEWTDKYGDVFRDVVETYRALQVKT